ncbi:MAG: hypothetical protein AB7N71_07060 [Phycisphaerae bacterium]
MQRGLILLLLGSMFAAGGCPMPPPPPADNGNENENVNENDNSNAIDTALSPGIYSGELMIVVQVFVDDEPESPVNTTRFLTETINDDGLPLLSNGMPIQSGATLTIGEPGNEQLLADVQSVFEAEDKLTVNFLVSGSRSGIDVTGTGSTTYTGTTDDIIDFELTLEFSGTSDMGQVIRQVESQLGRLRK